MTAEVFATATFCDDIRQERGNKYSLMGCYGPEIILDELPTVLAKLCANISVAFPIDTKATDVTVRARIGDDIVGEIKLPKEDVEKNFAAIRASAKEDVQRLTIGIFMIFSPLAVSEPDTLFAEVDTDFGLFRAGRLGIRARRDGDPVF